MREEFQGSATIPVKGLGLSAITKFVDSKPPDSNYIASNPLSPFMQNPLPSSTPLYRGTTWKYDVHLYLLEELDMYIL